MFDMRQFTNRDPWWWFTRPGLLRLKWHGSDSRFKGCAKDGSIYADLTRTALTRSTLTAALVSGVLPQSSKVPVACGLMIAFSICIATNSLYIQTPGLTIFWLTSDGQIQGFVYIITTGDFAVSIVVRTISKEDHVMSCIVFLNCAWFSCSCARLSCKCALFSCNCERFSCNCAQFSCHCAFFPVIMPGFLVIVPCFLELYLVFLQVCPVLVSLCPVFL